MLTGEIPAGHFSPPSQTGNIDPRLDDVVYRMLANKPEERFSNAQEVKTALEQLPPYFSTCTNTESRSFSNRILDDYGTWCCRSLGGG